jgi:hypothetical protein
MVQKIRDLPLCLRRGTLHSTPADPVVLPLSRSLICAAPAFSGLAARSEPRFNAPPGLQTLTKRFIAPAGDVSFLMPTPLTTTRITWSYAQGPFLSEDRPFTCSAYVQLMGRSGLSLTNTYQVDVGSDDSHTISKVKITMDRKIYHSK